MYRSIFTWQLLMQNRTTVLGGGKEFSLTNFLERKTYRHPGFQLNASQDIGNYCKQKFGSDMY